MSGVAMEGILFGDFRVAIDPRSLEVGGSWQGERINGYPSAWNRTTIQFFYENARRFEKPKILDIGANTGSYCLLAKAIPTLEGFAFEPNPEIFSILSSNLELNGVSTRMRPVQVGLAERAGQATLKIPARGQSGLATLGNPLRFTDWSSVNVPVLKLDDFAAEHLPDGVDLIKIDTEGCELPILMGAQALLAKSAPDVLCEFYPMNTQQFGYVPEQILEFMQGLGYMWAKLSEEDMYFLHRSKLQ
jgi:FkbM family methyltransferase